MTFRKYSRSQWKLGIDSLIIYIHEKDEHQISIATFILKFMWNDFPKIPTKPVKALHWFWSNIHARGWWAPYFNYKFLTSTNTFLYVHIMWAMSEQLNNHHIRTTFALYIYCEVLRWWYVNMMCSIRKRVSKRWAYAPWIRNCT